MRKLLFIFIVVAVFISAITIRTFAATNYYFDATNGNDLGAGTQNDPYKTLAKLDTLTLVAGDIVYLKRGETWYESTAPNTNGSSGNPVIFDAYGSGNLPIISGEVFITSAWTNTTGDEYKIILSAKPEAVYENGTTQLKGYQESIAASAWSLEGFTNIYKAKPFKQPPIAVYANANSSTPTLLTQNTTWDSSDNDPPLNAGEWYHMSGGDSIRLYVHLPDSSDPAIQADGYVLFSVTQQGNLNAGEYFYDAPDNELHVRLSDSVAPQSSEISYPTRTNCMTFTDKGYLAIQNIQCEKTKEEGFLFTNSGDYSEYTFNNIRTEYTGLAGLLFDTGSATVTTGVTVQNSNIMYYGRNAHWYIPQTSGLTYGERASGIALGNSWTNDGSFNTTVIKNNLIEYGTKGISRSDWGQWYYSSSDSGIFVNKINGMTFEENEINGGGHAV